MKILILGYSRSGKAAYSFLKDKNDVYIYDKKKINEVKYYSYYRLKKELPYFDLVIRSPGIKITSKIYQLSVQLSKKVISEVELGLSYLENKLIGVTGSNGKTTLVNMLYVLLKDKFNVHKLGNIGIPITSKISEIKKGDIVIVELSSFQLENISSIKFDIGVITNLLPNHFDSVFSKECYYASKLKLLNLSKIRYIDNSVIKYQNRANKCIKSEELTNYHNSNLNHYNQLYWNIACDISLKLGVTKEELKNKQMEFKMEHYRMEEVGKSRNFVFINDSKSTSVSSVNACLNIYNNKKRLIILGGISKNENFKTINKKKDDIILSFGKSGYKIFNEIGDFYFNSLEDVLKFIRKKYFDEYYVIFSPGCASFDQYASYIERGEIFNKLVNNLFYI